MGGYPMVSAVTPNQTTGSIRTMLTITGPNLNTVVDAALDQGLSEVIETEFYR